jgi:hypothetical protein
MQRKNLAMSINVGWVYPRNPTAQPGATCQIEFRLIQVKLLTAASWRPHP